MLLYKYAFTKTKKASNINNSKRSDRCKDGKSVTALAITIASFTYKALVVRGVTDAPSFRLRLESVKSDASKYT